METKLVFAIGAAADAGKFTDVVCSLLPLVDGGCDSRRWRLTFGLERPQPTGQSGMSVSGRAKR